MRLSPQGLLGAILLLRIIAQYLCDHLGFSNAAAVPLHSPLCQRLHAHVIAGRWGECLETIQAEDPGPGVQTIAAYLILRQQFLELLGLGGGERLAASRILWFRIYPLDVSRELICELRRQVLSLDGAITPEHRRRQRICLFLQLVQLLPPRMGVQSRRLGRCWY